MMKNQALQYKIAMLAFAVATSGLAIDAALAQEPMRGGTLTVGRPDEPLTFDPFTTADNGSIFAIAQTCEPLVLANATGTGLEPGLATSWTISDDRLSYTFELRKGVTFSDGSLLKADDVVFSIQKVMDPAASYGFAFEPVKSIEKLDDGHVKITLKTPYTPLLSTLSLFSASIVSKAAYEAGPEKFGSNPVCTGPFVVNHYERGTEVDFTANTHYWKNGADGKPLPYVDKLVLRYMPDSNSRVLALQNGDVDVALSVPLNQAASVKSMDNVRLEVAPSYRLDYVYLNHAKHPLDDKNVRLALNYATNHDALMKAVYFGYGEIPNSFTPKVNFWAKDVVPLRYDLEKAKELLKQSKYDGTPIEVMVDTGNATSRQTATILQASWAKIGIKTNIVEYDSGTSYDRMQKGEFNAYLSYITSDINDSDELATLQGDIEGSTHAFFSNYRNDELRQLIKQAREESATDKRAELYRRIQEMAYKDGYNVPLNFLPFINGVNTRVQDWQNIAVGWWWAKTAWLAK